MVFVAADVVVVAVVVVVLVLVIVVAFAVVVVSFSSVLISPGNCFFDFSVNFSLVPCCARSQSDVNNEEKFSMFFTWQKTCFRAFISIIIELDLMSIWDTL